MLTAFIHIRLLDVIDIILVAILLYQLYLLIRGTVAYSITMGIAIIYIFWWRCVRCKWSFSAVYLDQCWV